MHAINNNVRPFKLCSGDLLGTCKTERAKQCFEKCLDTRIQFSKLFLI